MNEALKSTDQLAESKSFIVVKDNICSLVWEYIHVNNEVLEVGY